jgi:putative aminopeptidase FrvX
MNYIEVIKDFMLTEAVSGYEKKKAYKLKSYLEPHADEVEIDRLGNTIAKIGGSDPSAPRIMVFAHVDQLGFIVRKIEENGLIQIDRLGGIPEKVLPALNVNVSTIDGEYIPGIIGNKAHHATSSEEKYKVDVVTSLFIDIGAKSKKQVLDAGIHNGCPVCYKPSFTHLMGSLVSGTSVDNRGGCTALAGLAETLAKEKPKSTVYLVGTVWEEFNLRGAIAAARHIKPDLAICFDVSLSGDTPDLSGKYDIGLSRGPTVCLYNFHGRGTLNGAIAHNGLYKHALVCAQKSGLPLQEFSSLGLLTDTAYVQLEGEGVGCLDMGFPARYTHSPIETCDITDIENLVKLSHVMLTTIDRKFEIKRF